MVKFARKLCALILVQVLLISYSLIAQDFNNYKNLKSSGQVPQKFLTSSTKKYEEEVKKLSTKEKNRLRRTKKQFFLQSSFIIDDMLLSGKVLFNDPVGIYVNKVVDEILKDDKDLRSKVEVYIIKTNQVNAFTTNNGIIFVTLGLVAQVENESELAYILCHEITHYVKQHNLNEYVENSNIKAGRGSYRGTNLDDKLLARSNYSKKQESEADLLGLERFLKTDYDASTLNGVFNVLEYSHLPFDDLTYKKSFIENSNLKLPPSYFLKKTKEIEASGDDDSLATHPAVKLRREAVMDKLKGYEAKGKKKFLVGEKDFENAQKICRYEMSTIFLHYREYEAAYYNTYLLMQDDSSSLYLKKCIAKSLYGLSKYANADRYDEAHDKYDDVQGSSQQVYYMFEKIKPEELNVLAVEYLYHLKKQYPEDKEIAALTEDIFSELPMYYEDKSFFSATPRPLSLDSMQAADTLIKDPVAVKDDGSSDEEDNNSGSKTLKKKNKYDKINLKNKKKEEKKELENKNYFIKYAFVDLVNDPAFKTDYDKAIELYKKKKKEDEYHDSREYKKAQIKKEKQEKRKGAALGLKKVVIVNPFYYKVDESKKEPIKLVASENAQKDFNQQVKENAKLAGLNFQLIDKKDLTPNSADLFNDISVLNYYIAESNRHDDMHYVNYMTDDIQALTQKYGTNYFDWMGIVAYRDHSIAYSITGLYSACYTFWVPPVFFVLMYNGLRPHYHTMLYSQVVDLHTGETIHNYSNKIKFQDRQDIVNSMLYDLCLQFKKHK
jgi:beta-barrel assembly-enhancing protease